MDLDKIYHGDCLELMPKHIKDKSVDMIFADLPYGAIAAKWDSKINIEHLWGEYNRVIKETGTIALFSAQPFTSLLINSNLKDFRYVWYWIKNQGSNFFHAKRMPLRFVEEICIFKKGKYFPQKSTGHVPTNSAKGKSKGRVYHGENIRQDLGGKTERYPKNTLYYKGVSNYSRLHESQKPLDLSEYLIRTYTNEGELVLDNTAGSGTTGLAAKNTNRNFILMEKEERSYRVCCDRIYKGSNGK